MEPEILDSARKRGIAVEDILHALRNAIREYPNQGDYDLTVAVGQLSMESRCWRSASTPSTTGASSSSTR